MDVNAMGLLVGGTLLLSIIFLIGLCLGCMRHTSITSGPMDGDYIQPGNFIVPRPGTHGHGFFSADSTHQPMSPRLQDPCPSPVIRPGFSTQSIDDSSTENGSYVNKPCDYVTPSQDYIIVIPDGCPSQSKESLNQSQGQESADEDYINIEKSKPPETEDIKSKGDRCSDTSEGENYINVSPGGTTAASQSDDEQHTLSQAGSLASMDSDKSEEYVNVNVNVEPNFGLQY